MTQHWKLLMLVLLSQVSYVVGEFFYKQGMTRPDGFSRGPFLVSGFLCQALSFFLWLGLLNEADLSYLFPFQSLNVIVITLGAAVILKEKLSAQLVIGMICIASGVALVFGS